MELIVLFVLIGIVSVGHVISVVMEDYCAMKLDEEYPN